MGSEFDSPQLADGADAGEFRRLRQAGGRVEFELGQAHLTVQGVSTPHEWDCSTIPTSRCSGGNLVMMYARALAGGDSWQIVGYTDREHREVRLQSCENRATSNAEAQHTVRLTPQARMIGGGGVRSTRSCTRPTAVLFFEPAESTINQVHGFAQA